MSELLRDVWTWLVAVFSYWQAYVTGGGITALAALIEKIIDRSLPRGAYLALFLGVFLIMSCFLSWRDEHAKAEEVRRAEHPMTWQRNADEVQRWFQRGITLTWQWQQGVGHFPNVESESEEWRVDMVARLVQKYGDRAAGQFNDIDLLTFRRHGVTVATPAAQHAVRVGQLNEVISRIARGEFRSNGDTPF